MKALNTVRIIKENLITSKYDKLGEIMKQPENKLEIIR
jgi:hypothetical protein